MQRTKRVPTRVHTRKLDRMVAHNKMKQAGVVKANNHKYGDSFLAEHWREANYI